jgi:EAL domain-containing protein (putative c-di-GMP-specific phosphodiesterase class I)
MKNADAAMYHAKEEGKNNYQFHSKATNSLSIERLALETNLRRALERNEFKLQYQAQVAAQTGEITGAEALLRWWNPDLGSVPPARFIPLAEDTGLIIPIGRWVLATACAQNVAWQHDGLRPIRMAVNISPRQFKDHNLTRDIAAALEQSGMAPGLLQLEITEGVIMHDVNQAVRQLHAIKEMGVRLAIDDFGTGYSSLAQLKRLPIDTLKVDRSFIREIPSDPDDKAITEAVIAMGKTLGVTVVAEGVETPEQHEFLSSRACNELQGFLYSKPCHPDALAELLRSKKSARRA